MQWIIGLLLIAVGGCAIARSPLAAQFEALNAACAAGTLNEATCVTERLHLEVAEQQIRAARMAAFGAVMAAQRPMQTPSAPSGPAYITNTKGQTVGYINQ